MKKHFFSILILIISFSEYGYSQENYTQEKGKVTQYEMSMTEYPDDKEAEAIVLYETGEYFFQGHDTYGFLLHMRKNVKIKILKQAGIKYANIEIPLYSDGSNNIESLEEINGTTYNYENNALIKTELDSKKIFEEKINNNVVVKRGTFPDVREGSVIEFNYTIRTPYFFNMREWEFQKKIPVVYSQLKYRAIPYFEYIYIAKGTNKLDEFNSITKNDDIRYGNLLYREVEYTFGMKDLPAFKDEEFITSSNDYMVALNFQLSKQHFARGGSKEIMTTWTAMCDDFLKDEYFGKYMKQCEKEAKKILLSLQLDDKTALDKAKIITEYVKSNFNWNGYYGKYAKTKTSDFLKQKTGGVANINLFLAGLLKAAGIETYPVVLSTRKNGLIRKGYPFQQFLNYVIVQIKVDEKTYNIDATESLLFFSDMPERCINVEGLVVKPKAEEWTYIRQRGASLSIKELTIDILPEKEQMDVNANFVGTGYSAYHYRSIYLGKDENLIKYLKDRNNIDVRDSKINLNENNNRLNKPFNFSFAFSTPCETNGNKIFINPFCNLSISNNPFKQTERFLPIDLMYARGENYKSTIKIPDGYKIEYLPEFYSSENELIKILYSTKISENEITVNASYILQKNIYGADFYNDLKMSFAEIIKKFSDMIVLVKE